MRVFAFILITYCLGPIWAWCPYHCLKCNDKDECEKCEDGFYLKEIGETTNKYKLIVCQSNNYWITLECTSNCKSDECGTAYYNDRGSCFRTN